MSMLKLSKRDQIMSGKKMLKIWQGSYIVDVNPKIIEKWSQLCNWHALTMHARDVISKFKNVAETNADFKFPEQ